jgi:phage gpG-like protein
VIELEVKDIQKVLTDLLANGKATVAAMVQGMYKGMVTFGGFVEKKQLSGRRGPGYGLNRPTGTLARSWRVTKNKEQLAVKLGFASKYAAIHQFGGVIDWPGTFDGFGKGIPIPPHDITIPKRLHIIEEFKQYGIRDIAEAALEGALKSYKK